MNKYLQFAVADLEPIQVAIGSGLVVGAMGATTVVIHSVDNESVYTLTGTEFTLIIAAQTNWMKAVSTVQIPIGQAVASIAIT